MLLVIRTILIFSYCIVICTLGSIYCLFSFRDPKNVAFLGHMFSYITPLLGIKVEIRKPKESKNFNNVIYIANHQNNYDIVTASNIVQSPTVILGKKSLLWIPLFGQLYWLSGNLFIDRHNRDKARHDVYKVVQYLKKNKGSVWIFPEGTRSRGRGLLPFKTGAFYIAMESGVSIVPICISNTVNNINLNRRNNGLVIVEMLPLIKVQQYKKNQVQNLKQYCQELMQNKIDTLNKEVIERIKNKKL